jgi:hypothetical protein
MKFSFASNGVAKANKCLVLCATIANGMPILTLHDWLEKGGPSRDTWPSGLEPHL